MNSQKLDNNQIKNTIKNSIFQKNAYTISVDFSKSSLEATLKHFIVGTLTDYKNFNNEFDLTIPNLIRMATPKFQRSNDKWSKEQKVAFVENVISGFQPEITLFTYQHIYDQVSYSKCYIFDGLQRITAISDFIEGKIKAFGKTYEEISKIIPLNSSSHFNGRIKIFIFNSVPDVIDFYVQMNKNITHAEKDIKKAKDYKKFYIEHFNYDFHYKEITYYNRTIKLTALNYEEIDYSLFYIHNIKNNETVDIIAGLPSNYKDIALHILKITDRPNLRSTKSIRKLIKEII